MGKLTRTRLNKGLLGRKQGTVRSQVEGEGCTNIEYGGTRVEHKSCIYSEFQVGFYTYQGRLKQHNILIKHFLSDKG